MPHTLFVHDGRGRGIASIPLGQVKGALGLTLVRGQRVERYDLRGRPSTITPVAPGGEPGIVFEIVGREDYLVARWPHAVAVTVSDVLFWLEDGRWRRAPDATADVARSRAKARCCPDGYDLPTKRARISSASRSAEPVAFRRRA